MTWNIDLAHSGIYFSARHLMIARVRGEFGDFMGEITFDPAHPEDTRVEVEVDTKSIDTRNEQRDTHLRSADFLNVEAFPAMRFRSTGVERVDEKRARLLGDLTIQDKTRPITLEVTYEGDAVSPWGTTSAGFMARGVVDRREWGMVWNQPLERGGLLVSNEVEISIELELVRQPETEELATIPRVAVTVA